MGESNEEISTSTAKQDVKNLQRHYVYISDGRERSMTRRKADQVPNARWPLFKTSLLT